ncbi:BrnA antitoxin family protein [Synechococcus sp. L2F]|nr:BrnA antitoxin family protein [Synechococcus sp. L2F]
MKVANKQLLISTRYGIAVIDDFKAHGASQQARMDADLMDWA